MRRLSIALVAGVLTALTLSAPAEAVPVPPDPSLVRAATAAPPPGSGWVLIPSPPFDLPAGPLCDFAVHGDPIEDEVYYKTLSTHPDGSVHVETATGPLVYRLTNVSTGRTAVGDASASGFLIHHADGARTYLNHGPLLVGFREGQGNLARGFYEIDGPAWTLQITADNHRTVSGAYHVVQNVCTTLS
ncbi:hypothetical protein ACIA8K_25010 [Catenuloplanes sp. NPDC051500]|uniref:hypothetical protein n=1 Tax=Catenuloplanes sp. NPDC051500 TaxID=3363959 RepID=UPI0037A39AC7